MCGRGDVHRVAATLNDAGTRVFRIDGRVRTASQLKVGARNEPSDRLPWSRPARASSLK